MKKILCIAGMLMFSSSTVLGGHIDLTKHDVKNNYTQIQLERAQQTEKLDELIKQVAELKVTDNTIHNFDDMDESERFTRAKQVMKLASIMAHNLKASIFGDDATDEADHQNQKSIIEQAQGYVTIGRVLFAQITKGGANPNTPVLSFAFNTLENILQTLQSTMSRDVGHAESLAVVKAETRALQTNLAEARHNFDAAEDGEHTGIMGKLFDLAEGLIDKITHLFDRNEDNGQSSDFSVDINPEKAFKKAQSIMKTAGKSAYNIMSFSKENKSTLTHIAAEFKEIVEIIKEHVMPVITGDLLKAVKEQDVPEMFEGVFEVGKEASKATTNVLAITEDMMDLFDGNSSEDLEKKINKDLKNANEKVALTEITLAAELAENGQSTHNFDSDDLWSRIANSDLSQKVLSFLSDNIEALKLLMTQKKSDKTGVVISQSASITIGDSKGGDSAFLPSTR